jgi:hypothetical protein
MRTFIATPEEFATGAAATKATELYRNRKRKPRLPQVRRSTPTLDRQIGTISPEDFAAGRPFWGKRVRGHRTEPVPTLKPLPETAVKARALVSALLECDDLSALPPSPEVKEGRLLESAKEFLKKHGLIRSREIKVERDPNHEAFLAIPILERPGERWTNLFRIPEQGAETAFKKRLEILVRTRRGYRPGDIFVSVLGKYLVTDDLTVKRL